MTLLVLAELSGEMRPMLESGFKTLHHHCKTKNTLSKPRLPPLGLQYYTIVLHG
ncbi:hypothetical protein SLEP1_g52354 [Rubroshorea leprosula]|uniref:Uncharacterized protein n=1 Tax=Rubroshorea leprosula TaxID=152421 RepID=A0AAV5M636_9ROSI|nr:hypothetical protein SLEP1_g52354 [Rubroshorea leprosula]